METIQSRYHKTVIKSTIMDFMKGKLSKDLDLDLYILGYLQASYRKPVGENPTVLRHYHNIDHILNGIENLKYFFGVKDSSKLSSEFVFAWLFHDCVYEVPAPTNGNEEESANEVLYLLEASNLNLNRIKELILLTKHDKNPDPSDFEANLIVELDLLGLSDPTEFFEANSELIRKEYSYYTNEQYGKGRLAFFENFLKLKNGKIYNLVPSRNIKALENIAYEMTYLKELCNAPE